MKYLMIGIFMIANSLFGQDLGISLYETFTHNKPDLNTKTEVYLGDKMLEQAEGSYKVCVIPKNTKVITKMGTSFEYRANEPICKHTEKASKYTVGYDNYSLRGSGYRKVPVKVKKTKSGVQLSQWGSGRATYPKNEIVISDRYFVVSENTFQQSIEYTGKTGDKLNFTYAETYNDYARAPFTRNFEIDLSQGDVAAFKGAIIKIHKATNVTIIYSVIRNFQS